MLAVLLALSPVVFAPTDLTLKVGTLDRKALLVVPSTNTTPAPVVFVYHGHGGNMRISYRRNAIHEAWPEAIVVYPEGLPTRTPRDPAGARNGWDMSHLSQNRDLALVDAMLAHLEKTYKVDKKKVFAVGHSNGGGFVYTLWATRGDRFAGFAPVAAAGARDLKSPKPAFIVVGEKDPIVDPERQMAAVEAVKKLNKSTEPGARDGRIITRFAGTQPLVTYVHPGAHEFPQACIAPIVKFFKEVSPR